MYRTLVLPLCVLAFTFGALASPTRNVRSPSDNENDDEQGEQKETSAAEAMQYLKNFQYVQDNQQSMQAHEAVAGLTHMDSLSAGLIMFQRFAGLNQTGVLDRPTRLMMTVPRCGNPDFSYAVNARRKRRYALQGSRWQRDALTYKIEQHTTDLSTTDVESEIYRAFNVWAKVTPLTFQRVYSGKADITVKFARGQHGDKYAFDGPGKTLAHAYFPQFGGDAHFDEDERWTIGKRTGTNLFQVAAHEFGHSLGLGHSDVRSALMAPFYRGFQQEFELDQDDIEGIQKLYGPPGERESTRSPTNGPKPTDYGGPELCQNSLVPAITNDAKGNTYMFRGNKYYLLTSTGVAPGYPRSIQADWAGLEGYLDTAFTWKTGHTFFFKGDKYWKFYDRTPVPGYPRLISEAFRGVPNNVDAAFVWSGNGKVYFIKGDQYYRFEAKLGVPSGYPRPLSVWEGLPNQISDAFEWTNGMTYFFSGNHYYRFNDKLFKVDSTPTDPYPRPTGKWWFGCLGSAGNLRENPKKVYETDNQEQKSQTNVTGAASTQWPALSLVSVLLVLGAALS